LQKIFVSLFLCENDFTANEYRNQAYMCHAVGPLCVVCGWVGPKAPSVENRLGPLGLV